MELLGNLDNPKVLVIGVFHGDEPQGEYLLLKYLQQKPSSKILAIPRLNSENTRVNKNGVDLNRNFPTNNWELTEKNEFFGGDFPASENETKFIINVVEKYNPEIILTLHAPFKVVNYDGDKAGKYRDLLKKISKIMGYPLEASIGYQTPGSFGTWAGVERGILTITLELDEDIEVSELEAPVFKVFRLLEEI